MFACLLCDQLHNLRRPRQLCCGNAIYSVSIFSLRKKCTYNFVTTNENEFLGLLRLKSANKTASTIVANIIGAISRNGRKYAWLAYDDEKNAMSCSSTSCCGGGQDTAGTIGIRGNNAFATDNSRTSKVSGGLVNFLVC